MCDMVRTSECLSDGEVSDGSDVEEPAALFICLAHATADPSKRHESQMFGQE